MGDRRTEVSSGVALVGDISLPFMLKGLKSASVPNRKVLNVLHLYLKYMTNNCHVSNTA